MSIQKRVWLTGASSGMGLNMAEQLAAQGHKLALTARSAQPLLELAERYPPYRPQQNKSTLRGGRWTW